MRGSEQAYVGAEVGMGIGGVRKLEYEGLELGI